MFSHHTIVHFKGVPARTKRVEQLFKAH